MFSQAPIVKESVKRWCDGTLQLIAYQVKANDFVVDCSCGCVFRSFNAATLRKHLQKYHCDISKRDVSRMLKKLTSDDDWGVILEKKKKSTYYSLPPISSERMSNLLSEGRTCTD